MCIVHVDAYLCLMLTLSHSFFPHQSGECIVSQTLLILHYFLLSFYIELSPIHPLPPLGSSDAVTVHPVSSFLLNLANIRRSALFAVYLLHILVSVQHDLLCLVPYSSTVDRVFLAIRHG